MDATANKLKAAIEHRYGGTAHLAFLDAVSITRQAQPACEGVVFVFDLVGHPEAERAYGWTSPVGKSGEHQFHVVLQVPPIASAQDAIRSMTVAESQSPANREIGAGSQILRHRAGQPGATKPARVA